MPKVVRLPKELRSQLDRLRENGDRIALVPTMGALHRGHLSLVEKAKQHADRVVVSIFVNPTQFGPGEDLDKYPRDLDGDLAKLSPFGVDMVFTPAAAVMYPAGACTTVHVSEITSGLCGAHRPGHFDGVATIVAKLFNIVGPCTAIFGRKDYQQLAVIRRMTEDLNLPVEVAGVPTVREPDGLAMSSRNAFLSADERRRAQKIPKVMAAAHELIRGKESLLPDIRRQLQSILEAPGGPDRIDYLELLHPQTLLPLDEVPKEGVLVATAVKVGSTRLIDNTVVGEDNPPHIETEN